jgi:CobQ-like glutamine amidotransferase family enzyme
MMELRLCYLYPDLMNIYGDRGNVITIVNRCRWRGIAVKVSELSAGATIEASEYDLYFFGGGQDREQITVAEDLRERKARGLRNAVQQGAALLSICGGYQLLCRYYQPFDAPKLDGIGIFDAWTEASNLRMIGNLAITLSDSVASEIGDVPKTVVGFENHSGKTHLGKDAKPLGQVDTGFGNNSHDKTEGVVYKHAIGCYMHGSLLPKNPHIADLVIRWALEHRYGKAELPALDDTVEWNAHFAALKRTRETH